MKRGKPSVRTASSPVLAQEGVGSSPDVLPLTPEDGTTVHIDLTEKQMVEENLRTQEDVLNYFRREGMMFEENAFRDLTPSPARQASLRTGYQDRHFMGDDDPERPFDWRSQTDLHHLLYGKRKGLFIGHLTPHMSPSQPRVIIKMLLFSFKKFFSDDCWENNPKSS